MMRPKGAWQSQQMLIDGVGNITYNAHNGRQPLEEWVLH